MTAIEALIWCLQHIRDEVIDGDISTQCVFDRNNNPHWVAWQNTGDEVSPRLCSDCWWPFAKSQEPYTKKRRDVK